MSGKAYSMIILQCSLYSHSWNEFRMIDVLQFILNTVDQLALSMIKSVGVTLNNAFEKWLLSSAQQLRDLGKFNGSYVPVNTSKSF